MNTRAENALQVAITQVGQTENPLGSNWGKPVQDYLKSVGIGFPASWCMAFVYWCVEESKYRVPDGIGGFKNPLVKTGGALRQWNEVNKSMKFKEPEAGDIFIMDFGKGLDF